ncbi:ATP-binding cassette domain-containing protein, partial [Xanthomonas sp. SHU 308]
MHPLVLEAQGLSKAYAGVAALEDVALRLRGGEIHALMGQNGAGKSTLIKLLTGVTAADAGRIALDGAVVAPASPQQAQRLGISTVYQEVNLCPNLSVAENLFAGRYPLRGWLRRIDWRRVEREAEAGLQRLGIAIDVRRALGSYPVAVQQMVAIARAVGVSARVLILDEPTSSLDEGEVAELFRVMRALRDGGMAILFVTHFLDQVYAVADRISVLRNGRLVGEYTPAELPAPQLVAAMVGRALDPASAAAAAVRA